MSKVLIKYGFIFDPSQTWSTQEQFENDLGKFFLSKGLFPEMVDATPGQEPLPIVYLSKNDTQLSRRSKDGGVTFKLKKR